MTPEQAGAILAALSISVHKTPPPPGVISLPDLICALVQSPGNLLPKHLARGVLALLESLPPGDGLCHGDVHPGNVIMTAEGPRLIDWTWTRRAGPALDLGHCHVVLCELIPENHDDPARPRALDGPRAGHPPLMRPRLTRSPCPPSAGEVQRAAGGGRQQWPRLMLAISVFSANLDALHSLRPSRQVPLDAPAAPDRIQMAAQACDTSRCRAFRRRRRRGASGRWQGRRCGALEPAARARRRRARGSRRAGALDA